jgi:Flp pilus assembly protein TadD
MPNRPGALETKACRSPNDKLSFRFLARYAENRDNRYRLKRRSQRSVIVRACNLAALVTVTALVSGGFGQFLPGPVSGASPIGVEPGERTFFFGPPSASADYPPFLPPTMKSRGDGPVAILPSPDANSSETRPAPELDDDGDTAAPKVRVANAEATARARQFIEYGDARFQHQQFADAYQRYRKAADSAPNLADAYFRQAFAQAALGRYRPAVNSIRRGLMLEPGWANTAFRLKQLYQRNQAAKETHFERLALTAENEPESAELMFLLGVELLLDDQPERAGTFLERAAELGLERKVVQPFLHVARRRSQRKLRGEEL